MLKMSKEMIVKQKAVKMGFKKVNVGGWGDKKACHYHKSPGYNSPNL